MDQIQVHIVKLQSSQCVFESPLGLVCCMVIIAQLGSHKDIPPLEGAGLERLLQALANRSLIAIHLSCVYVLQAACNTFSAVSMLWAAQLPERLPYQSPARCMFRTVARLHMPSQTASLQHLLRWACRVHTVFMCSSQSS